MTSTSSRILRGSETALVEPVWWRSASAPVAAVELSQMDDPQADDSTPGPSIDLERAEQLAYQRGFSEGKSVGISQNKAETDVVVNRLTKSLGELALLRSRIRKDAESDLLKLSIAIARRVLHRELTLDPDSIAGVIRVALEKLDSRELYRVRTHPDQEEAVRNTLARLGGTRQVETVPDPSLQSGDVLFETPQGALDASIESQLREVERGFADRLGR